MAAVATHPEQSIVQEKLAGLSIDSTPPTQTTASSRAPSFADSLRNPAAGVLKTPYVDPIPTAKPTPSPELTDDQQAKYTAFLESVKSWKEIPVANGKGGPVTESEIMWLTRECLLRYLRATKWIPADAAKRLLGTLTWRREFGVEALTPEFISPENETGKQIILGYDIAARPCLYLNPGRQNTDAGPRQVQHLVFMLERVIAMGGPGQETLALLINFKSGKSKNSTPGMGIAREILNILQMHYPERLGRALIINVPFLVNGFFRLITPFIDPMTRDKLKFNDDMRQHVPPQQLWNEFHGDVEFEYDHNVYWPAITKLTEERWAEQKERWVQGGKQYGESENYMKGGNTPSMGSSNKVTESSSSVAQAEAGQTPTVV